LKNLVPKLTGTHVTVLGVSYLNDVADTRYSPTELFYDLCVQDGAIMHVHDPLVSYWVEKQIPVETRIESLKQHPNDVAVFAVRHSEYVKMSASEILSALPGVKVVIDTFNIIADGTAKELAQNGVTVRGVGKGHWQIV
jgi:UDP-N-acetyl-D-mannosaminuronate dehydrogenase